MKGYYREFQDGDDPTQAIYFAGPLIRVEIDDCTEGYVEELRKIDPVLLADPE